MAKSVEIKGLDKLLRKVQHLSDVVKEDVDTECRLAAHEMNDEASRNINVKHIIHTGELLSKQQVIETPPIYRVINSCKYAPYHEFGTGVRFDALPDWVPIAAQFKGAGIRRVNITPRPFMQPAFEKVAPLLIKRVKNIIKEALAS